jgi:hypothetical protein
MQNITTRVLIRPRAPSCHKGRIPALMFRIASMAKLRGFTEAIVRSHSGITSYGISALEVKNNGREIMVLNAASES